MYESARFLAQVAARARGTDTEGDGLVIDISDWSTRPRKGRVPALTSPAAYSGYWHAGWVARTPWNRSITPRCRWTNR